MVSQAVFIVIVLFFLYLIYRRIERIRSNINLGRPREIKDHSKTRWKNVLLIAFGQKKMFKRIVPAIFHFIIYVGFILINIEVLEIIIDGVSGSHRAFVSYLGSFYTIMISFFEIMALGVIVACLVFLIRRNILRIKRFHKVEMIGWPSLDANLILVIEILLMAAILTMNATDLLLQEKNYPGYHSSGAFLISDLITPLFEWLSAGTLFLIERFCWWFHIIGIFAFALYITYSKHLHIFMAFPNTYFGSLEPMGKMNNMPEITNEVKIMMGMPGSGEGPPEGLKFGARDIGDLTWKNIMDAYACTECGRCTSECPANLTGKKLSPRKIMMDTRDRAEELGEQMNAEKYLLEGYISKEEINACTSCNACVEACPVSINPLDIILQLRRYVSMEESGSPQAWNAMFSNVETNFAPWKFAASDRFKWGEELKNKNN